MTQVGVAGAANGFDALQESRPVEAVSDDIILDRLGERWPAGIGLEFLRCIEKHRVAAQAGIDSRLKEAAHFRAEGALCSGPSGDVVFLVSELSAPFGVRFDDLAIRRGVAVLRQIQNIGPFDHHTYILGAKPDRSTLLDGYSSEQLEVAQHFSGSQYDARQRILGDGYRQSSLLTNARI
jgi:hypothetical protein